MKTILNRTADPFPPPYTEFTIHRYGIHESIDKTIHRPSGNTDYLFMLLYDSVPVGTSPAAPLCPADTFMIWEPGQSHYYGTKAHPWGHSWFHCDGTSVAGTISQNGLPVNRPFSLADPVVMEKYLGLMHNEIVSFARPERQIIASLFRCLAIEIGRSIRAETARNIPAGFLDVRNYMEAGFRRRMTLAELAKRACLSVSRFSSEFRRYFGCPAIDYLIRIRMQHAAFLLRDVNMSVGQVAQESGYEDIYYFSKLFRKFHGVSPRGYRRKIQA